jgi:hypothetical protein
MFFHSLNDEDKSEVKIGQAETTESRLLGRHGIALSLTLALVIFAAIQMSTFMGASAVAARNLHDKALDAVLKAPLDFFRRSTTGMEFRMTYEIHG